MNRKKIKNKEKNLEQVETPKSYRRAASQLLKLLATYKQTVIIAVLFNVIASSIYIGIPYLSAVAIDNVLGILNDGQGETVVRTVAAIKIPVVVIVILAIVTIILNYIEERIMARVGENIAFDLRKKLTAKLNKLPLSYYDSVKVGELISKATADVDKVAEVVLTGFNQLIYSVVTIIAGFIILFSIHPSMTVVVLGIIVICMFGTQKIAMFNQKLYGYNMSALGELSGSIEEIFSGDLEVKVFNQQGSMIAKADDLIEKQFKAHRYFQFVNFSIYPAMRLINHLGFIVCAVWGSYLAAGGFLTIGILQAYLQYVVQISEPITQSAYLINSLQIGLAAVERVYEVLDLAEERDTEASLTTLEAPKGQINFEDVTFSYGNGSPVLKNINFEAEAKKRIAIVGATGSGKTTLVNLLMRFYDVEQGRITFDGKNIRELSKRELRSHLGMVLQDTWLFEGTVTDNILFGNRQGTQADVEEVAKLAQCHDFISQLPLGYQTIISSDSSMISQGQQQLITIARAMLSNPKVMILDEATSSVDTETERKIQKALANLLENRTSFIIAHRLTTIRGADVILVLDHGLLVERGSHESLLAQKGKYYDLVHSQGQMGLES